MPNWETRLEISVGDHVVTPIKSFMPSFSTPVTVIHSIEQDNVGYVYKPQTATFSMEVEACSTSAAELTQMALEGTRFDIQMAERSGTDWSFSRILFRDCVITGADPSTVSSPDSPPTAKFSGAILGFRGANDITT